MKLLVKVVEAEYSDTPQIAIVDVSLEFFTTAQDLIKEAELISEEMNAPASLRIDNNLGEYFVVNPKDLPRLFKEAKGNVSEWEDFTHLILRNEKWSRKWRKIDLHDRCAIVDQTGMYFRGTDEKGNDYVTAPLVGSELTSSQSEQIPALTTAV